MASPDQVKQYLAYWFQLGKRLIVRNGEKAILPQPVIQGDRYSAEFEDCWQYITKNSSKDCYLEGTVQTIDELLSSRWDISPCARCDMPVPMMNLGLQPPECPCADLPLWPNTELPKPRSPVSNQTQLNSIRDRLRRSHQNRQDAPVQQEGDGDRSLDLRSLDH
ncbi:hypothetical protein [Egbenema bharatensis]|uniref:hypothetical protein n=1 Tax=Egbenema bharatensis TaxID=3463334 RepID=UPI003A858B2C